MMYTTYLFDEMGNYAPARECIFDSNQWWWPNGNTLTDWTNILILSHEEITALAEITNRNMAYRIAMNLNSRDRDYRVKNSDYLDIMFPDKRDLEKFVVEQDVIEQIVNCYAN